MKGVAKDVHVLSYPDHHYFLTRDLEEIRQAYENWQVEDKIIVTTQKDATRLLLHHERLVESPLPIVVLPIQVAILFDEGTKLDATVQQYVAQTLEANDE
jgi:tetraacyldisaccharide 4'-kinase